MFKFTSTSSTEAKMFVLLGIVTDIFAESCVKQSGREVWAFQNEVLYSPNGNCQIKTQRAPLVCFCLLWSWIMPNLSNVLPGSKPKLFCVSLPLSGGSIGKFRTNFLPWSFLSWMSIFSFVSVLPLFFFYLQRSNVTE